MRVTLSLGMFFLCAIATARAGAPSLTIFTDTFTEQYCYYDGYVQECKSTYNLPAPVVAKTQVLAADGNCVLTPKGVHCSSFVAPKSVPASFAGDIRSATLLTDSELCAVVGTRVWCSDEKLQRRVDRFPAFRNPTRISNPPFGDICVVDEGNAIFCVNEESEVRRLDFASPTEGATVLGTVCALDGGRVKCNKEASPIESAFAAKRVFRLVGGSDALCGITGDKKAFCFRPHFSKEFEFDVSTAKAITLSQQSFCQVEEDKVRCQSLFSDSTFSAETKSERLLGSLHVHTPSFCTLATDGSVGCRERDRWVSPFGPAVAKYFRDESVYGAHFSPEYELMLLSRRELRIFGAQRRFTVNPSDYEGAAQLHGEHFIKNNRVYHFAKTSPSFEAGIVSEIACGDSSVKHLVPRDISRAPSGPVTSTTLLSGGRIYSLPDCRLEWELPKDWPIVAPVGMVETPTERCIADARSLYCESLVDKTKSIHALAETVRAVRQWYGARLFLTDRRIMRQDGSDAFTGPEPLAPVLGISREGDGTSPVLYSVGAVTRQLYHLRGTSAIAGHAVASHSEPEKTFAFDGTIAAQVAGPADLPVLLFILARTADPQEKNFLARMARAHARVTDAKSRGCISAPLYLDYLLGSPAATLAHEGQAAQAAEWLRAHSAELAALATCGKTLELMKAAVAQLIAVVKPNESLLPAASLADWHATRGVLRELVRAKDPQAMGEIARAHLATLTKFESTLKQHFYLRRRALFWMPLVTYLAAP